MVAPREASASQSPRLTSEISSLSQVSPLASPCVLKALAVQRRLSHGPFPSRTIGACKLSVVSTPIPYTVKPETREVWTYIWDPTCSCGGTLIGVCIRFPWSLLTITGPERWPMGSLSLSCNLFGTLTLLRNFFFFLNELIIPLLSQRTCLLQGFLLGQLCSSFCTAAPSSSPVLTASPFPGNWAVDASHRRVA